MPRTARIDMPNLLQHVMVRGIERRDIFIDDADRLDFVLRFSSLLEATETECLAWALLSNHIHLLIRVTSSTPTGVSIAVRRGEGLVMNNPELKNRVVSCLIDE